MVFFSMAIMHIGVYVCATVLSIHFNNYWLMLMGMAASILLPKFEEKRTYHSDKTSNNDSNSGSPQNQVTTTSYTPASKDTDNNQTGRWYNG